MKDKETIQEAMESGETVFYRGKEYRMVNVLKFKPARERKADVLKKTTKKVKK